jgi:hypothetical protein
MASADQQETGIQETVQLSPPDLADLLDAARYRWLRNEARKMMGEKAPYVVYGDGGVDDFTMDGELLDTMIDAILVSELPVFQTMMALQKKY